MRVAMDPFRLLLISLAGWLNQRQQEALDYLQEENCVLREQLGGKRLHFNDDQRRRLPVRAKKLSCSAPWPRCRPGAARMRAGKAKAASS